MCSPTHHANVLRPWVVRSKIVVHVSSVLGHFIPMTGKKAGSFSTTGFCDKLLFFNDDQKECTLDNPKNFVVSTQTDPTRPDEFGHARLPIELGAKCGADGCSARVCGILVYAKAPPDVSYDRLDCPVRHSVEYQIKKGERGIRDKKITFNDKGEPNTFCLHQAYTKTDIQPSVRNHITSAAVKNGYLAFNSEPDNVKRLGSVCALDKRGTYPEEVRHTEHALAGVLTRSML